MSYKEHFSRFLQAAPDRLHFAAHSHHFWPDVTFDAQQRAWLDAARWADTKWGPFFEGALAEARGHVARQLNLSDSRTVAFAPNVHEFLVRAASSLTRQPFRILTTDAEFHSFSRQCNRWIEAGVAVAERVPLEPFETFSERFLGAARAGEHDLIYVSHVFFNTGFVFDGLSELPGAVSRDETLVFIDAYHAFMVLPTDLSAIESRLFYAAGGYKYAMSGEGVCFAHCPPGYAERPVNTGWFAEFGELMKRRAGEVPYAADATRMMGATYDPVGVYRFNAVQDLWRELGVSIADIHAHVRSLQESFLSRLEERPLGPLGLDRLVPDRSVPDRGHFLTFRLPEAGEIFDKLLEAGVVTDRRGDRLRFGFGIYHDPEDVEALSRRLAEILAPTA